MKNLYLSEDEKNKILNLHKSFLLKEIGGGSTTEFSDTYAPAPAVTATNAQQNTGNITIKQLQTKLGVGSDGKLGTGTLGVIQQKLGISTTTAAPSATSLTTANPANTSTNTVQPSKVGDPGVVPDAITNQVTVKSVGGNSILDKYKS